MITADSDDKRQVYELYKFLALKAGKHPYVANQRAAGYVQALNTKVLSNKYKKRCDICGYAYGFFAKKCPKCGSSKYTREAFITPLYIDIDKSDERYNPENTVLGKIERKQFVRYVMMKAIHGEKLITILHFLLLGYHTGEIAGILKLSTAAIRQRKRKLQELYNGFTFTNV